MRFAAVVVRLAALLLLLQVQACVSPGSDGSAASGSASEYVPQSGLSDKARFRQVLKLLEGGQPEAARAELLLYLEAQPHSDVGRDLLQQIDIPVADYFPAESRTVVLQPGYSLSTLARIYLGSVYRFHALAKYNGITQPRTLTAGQSIRIPLTRSAKAAFEAEAAAAAVGETVTSETVTNIEESAPPDLLESADESLEDLVETEVETTAAGGDLESGLPQDVKEVPDAAPVRVVQATEIDAMHREALNAYRAQDLDTAIGIWDQLLELDPSHDNARLYRSQAVELRKKLSSLL